MVSPVDLNRDLPPLPVISPSPPSGIESFDPQRDDQHSEANANNLRTTSSTGQSMEVAQQSPDVHVSTASMVCNEDKAGPSSSLMVDSLLKDETFLPFLESLRIPEEDLVRGDAAPMYTEDASPHTAVVFSSPFSDEDIAYIKRNDSHLIGRAIGTASGTQDMANRSNPSGSRPCFNSLSENSYRSDGRDQACKASSDAEGFFGGAPRIEAEGEIDHDGRIQVDVQVKDPSGRLKRTWYWTRIRSKDVPHRPSASDGVDDNNTSIQTGARASLDTTSSMMSSPIPSLRAGPVAQPTSSGCGATADHAVRKSFSRSKEKGSKDKGKGRMRDGVIPVMNIVIFIVGSRGDVQPYVALALQFILSHGHRVRIATHPNFKDFIIGANDRLRGKFHNDISLEGRLEFFDVGGDPKELMAYMVKNPGLLPGMESLTNGDIKRKRQMTSDMLRGFYRSTFSPDLQSGKAFAADAIISNPPAFAHIHVAEALGIPLHLSFTMPWTATNAFPHPLVSLRRSNADSSLTNYVGYAVAEMLMWEGLGGTINTFREEILRLPALPDRVATTLIDNLKIPWTYCWSPELLPRPSDWRGHVDVSGFYFLDSEETYRPPPRLAAFLSGRSSSIEEGIEAGFDGSDESRSAAAPIYIGFGSVVIQDPETVTSLLFEAIKDVGVRAIISSGWAGLGKGREEEHEDIHILNDDCPHEWLFAENRVKAVMHHGGAGTTACGLSHGRPTIIIPFFGDQRFWGDAVCNAGAGPAPIPFKKLTTEKIVSAIKYAISAQASHAAGILGEKIRAEKGEAKGVEDFHRNLPIDALACDIDSRRAAAWWWPKQSLKISVEAAAALLKGNKIFFSDLEPYRTVEYETTRTFRDPISSIFRAIPAVFSTPLGGVVNIFHSPRRGAVKTTWGFIDAMFNVAGDMYEGFENVPAILGSTPRPRGRVTNWKNGILEGTIAGLWGCWDAGFGFFTDPIDGALREGWIGCGKGLIRGSLNVPMRTLQGALAFLILPVRGLKLSIQSAIRPNDIHSVLRGAREQTTKEAFKEISQEEANRLLEIFAKLEKETKRRKRKLRNPRWFLISTEEERAKEREWREKRNKASKERLERRKLMKEQKKLQKQSKEKNQEESKASILMDDSMRMDGEDGRRLSERTLGSNVTSRASEETVRTSSTVVNCQPEEEMRQAGTNKGNHLGLREPEGKVKRGWFWRKSSEITAT